MPIETPDSAIVITLGMDSSHYNRYDATLHIGVTDLSKSLRFGIIDVQQYRFFPPCYPITAISSGNRVSEGTKVPSTFKLTLLLKDSFGYCETAQEGGYINVEKFYNVLDLSRPLYLQLVNWIEWKEHFIHYISIESK